MNRKKVIATIIILFFLTVLVGGGTMIYKAVKSSNFLGDGGGKNDILQPVVGGDRDEHGCIGSAGYSWCEEKQRCLRVWEEECGELNLKNDTDSFSAQGIPPLPSIFPNIKWTEDEPEDNLGAIVFKSDDDKFYNNDWTPSGRQWNAGFISEDARNLQIMSDFYKYYENNLTQNGWGKYDSKGAGRYENYTFNPLIADSPYGSLTGFIKISGDNLQIVMLSYGMTPTGFRDVPDEISEPKCPCDYGFSVFISDLIKIKEIIK